MEELKEAIRMWYRIDKQIDEYNTIAGELRDKRNSLEKKVLELMKTTGLDKKKLNIGPISIIYSRSNQLPPYNLELIENSLNTLYSKGHPETTKVLTAIQTTRETLRKPNHCIKKRKNKATQKKNRDETRRDETKRDETKQV